MIEKTKKASFYFVTNRIVTVIYLIAFAVILLQLVLPLFQSDLDAALAILDFLRILPTKSMFYVLLASTPIFIFLRNFLQNAKFESELILNEKIVHQAIIEMKRHAYVLRSGASLLLVSVFVLLGSGFYFIVFLLPQIEVLDKSLAQQRQLILNFESEFNEIIESIVESQYWLEFKFLSFANQENIYRITSQRNDKNVLVVGSNGSLFSTSDGGNIWEESKLDVADNFRVDKTWFSENGMNGIVVGDDGSVFSTHDGGNIWEESKLDVANNFWVVEVWFSENGMNGIVVGDDDSAYVTQNGGKEWGNIQGLKSARFDGINLVKFSGNGMNGIVVGDDGSVFSTDDGGKKWEESKLDVVADFWVVEVWYSENSMKGIVVGDDGSVFSTDDGGKKWEESKLDVTDDFWVVETWFSENSMKGIVVGSDGTMFSTDDGGKKWEESKLDVTDVFWVDETWFSENGMNRLVVGSDGTMFSTDDGGKKWEESKLDVTDDFWVDETWFSENGMNGIVVGDDGSVFVTLNGGKEWDKSQGLESARFDGINLVEFSRDGQYRIILDDRGTVFVTNDGGKNWTATNLNEIDGNLKSLTIMLPTRNHTVVAINDHGNAFILKNYSELMDWKSWPALKIRKFMQNDELLNNSKVYKDISEFLLSEFEDENFTLTAKTKNKQPSTTENRRLYLDDLTVLRSASLAILFFLAQLLTRFAQYNLRLASFWESRSLSIRLKSELSNNKSDTFDDLVYALAPDSYDFKPMPSSLLSRYRNRQNQ